MLTPPDLPEDALVAVLGAQWAIEVAALEYVPLGFGSHHWRVAGPDGQRWFVTVDETGDPAQEFERLRAALGTARGLRDAGLDFVVAPIRGIDGEVIACAGERFAVACYPLLEGRQFDWGEFRDEEHRQAVFDMIVAVHRAPPPDAALTDDFGIAYRDEFACAPRADAGPYAAATADLLADNEQAIQAAWARYDDLVAAARRSRPRLVVTHGEPHAGNTVRTAGGWRLIDWDTARLAPPERDLWDLDPGDGSLWRAYAAATGVTPDPALIELYRRRWDLTDAAEYVHRFRRPHTGSADDTESWNGLCEVVSRMATTAPLSERPS
ncbi:spectinomycin phosphotransferase/16S rRNA (guanine(1405)-N(7))-methyltransferase [Nocardia transvalensis]|uniref:Spectinomycin phosphotransferase/16S rRNA (Guanine(1405)-N(7))-methyltransferase n=1 Tax=Nocardia transvalensis TaxID=37333 RepID=A0A7W9UIQ6_9NOCA|nr:aminoglycoside phosphotransferase family protein [Nocardia transvalensis]MBB5914521.1 spectinomycin phosphotransferase/16S rRNA (guanine(1405)-N(7))-methyltransferase [Nocardia transvalensis]